MVSFRNPFKHKSRKSTSVPTPNPPTKPAPGDLPIARAKGQKITPDELRELRENIRYRYLLDFQIWNKRDVVLSARPKLQESMNQADAMLTKIKLMVDSWDKPEYFPSKAEYEKFQQIKTHVYEDGKRNWAKDPPWKEQETKDEGLSTSA